MCFPVSVQSWGSKISCISLMGKAPSSQTGDIPYYHPSVTETGGSLLTVSTLDLFCWVENLPWGSRFHGEEPSEIQMWRLQTQILRVKIWFLESPGSEWLGTTAFRGGCLTAQERSFTTVPTSQLPLHQALLLRRAVLLSVSTGIEVAFNFMVFQLIPMDMSKACDYCRVSTPHVRLFIYIRALLHSC